MAAYTAEIRWSRAENEPFTDGRYSRRHEWLFDGGTKIPASSSPHVVPLPLSAADAVDPEEAFVASLSSCHMLWFLDLARRRGFVVETYVDDALGVMAKNASGKLAMTRVTLRPLVTFAQSPTHPAPSHEDIAVLHHAAHEECYLASSVLTDVLCEPRFPG